MLYRFTSEFLFYFSAAFSTKAVRSKFSLSLCVFFLLVCSCRHHQYGTEDLLAIKAGRRNVVQGFYVIRSALSLSLSLCFMVVEHEEKERMTTTGHDLLGIDLINFSFRIVGKRSSNLLSFARFTILQWILIVYIHTELNKKFKKIKNISIRYFDGFLFIIQSLIVLIIIFFFFHVKEKKGAFFSNVK